MPERVHVYSPDGQLGTVPAAAVDTVVRAGGRVATSKEIAGAELDAAYAQKSTASKVAGYAAALTGPVGMAAAGAYAGITGDVPALPPEMQAYYHGVSKTLTGGLADVAVQQGIKAVAGNEAAKAYGKSLEQVEQAHGGIVTAGEIAGIGAGIIAGGPKAGFGAKAALPGAGIGAVGNLVEGAAARGLAGLAAKGVAGRAAATGLELAARGATEGAMLGAAQQLSDDIIKDHEVTAERMWAAAKGGAGIGLLAGGALGVGGSLTKSAVGGVINAAKGGLSRLVSKTEAAAGEALAAKADDAAASAAKTAVEGAEALGVKPAQEASGLKKVVDSFTDKGLASKANDLAFDALGTTRKVADKINTEVKGGTNSVGEWMNRRILKATDADTTVMGTVMKGRADDLLPMIQAEKAKIGAEIGDVVKGSPVRVALDEAVEPAGKIIDRLNKDPALIGGGKQLQQKVFDLIDAFHNKGIVGADGKVPLSDLYYARAGMENVAHEFQKGTPARQAVNEWLREVDGMLVNKLDDAAVGGVKDKLLGLKREYQLGTWAEKAAKDGSNRISGNNAVGLREGIGAAVGIATGNPILGTLTAIGGKVLRERGSAAGAVLLSKAADMGAVSRAHNYIDGLLTRASKGLLEAPKPVKLTSSNAPVQERAQVVLKNISEARADPQGYIDGVTRQTESLSATAPKLAGALQQQMVRAATYVWAGIPTVKPPDPFSPSTTPKLTDAQAARVVRRAEYVDNPEKVFEEASNGKFTRDGVEFLQTMMPRSYAELQSRVAEQLAEAKTRGIIIPFSQREKIGILLDIPAVASQRPDHMRLLQANVVNSEAAKPASSPPSAPRRPFQTQQSALSGLDSFESRRLGNGKHSG